MMKACVVAVNALHGWSECENASEAVHCGIRGQYIVALLGADACGWLRPVHLQATHQQSCCPPHPIEIPLTRRKLCRPAHPVLIEAVLDDLGVALVAGSTVYQQQAGQVPA